MAINPLQPPINYAAQMVNLAPAFQGFGEAIAQRRERTQLQEAKVEADRLKAVYATDLQAVLDNPSMKAFNEFSLKYPQQREAVKDVASRFTQEQQDAEFDIGRDIAVSLENKNPDAALNILNKAIVARKNSNLPTTVYDQIQQILSNTDDPDRIKKAQAQTNFSLTLLNPEKFGKVVESLEKQRLGPSVLSKSVADADKAVADATTAQATATNAAEKAKADAALATALADKAKVDAQYAEGAAKDAVKKRAADLGLTTAQTNQALASTRKLNTEIKKAALELEALKASGGVDPAKKFDQEEKIRKEWQGRSKVYSELGGIYSNLKASADAKTGPGDIALITGFMKMLDPGSVVRETEFATARDTAGLFAVLSNQAQKIQSGQLFALDSKQRQEYVALAEQYLKSAEKKAAEEKKDLGIVVKNYKLNPENVFGATRNVTVDY